MYDAIKEQERSEKRKKEIINQFINHTTYIFVEKIYNSYPYRMEDADISSYKELFKSQLNIPMYPISDEEWDWIISEINARLEKIVTQLIKECEVRRGVIPDDEPIGKSSTGFYLD